MKYFKIEKGKLISGTSLKNTLPDGYRNDWENLPTKEDGSYYTYYIESENGDILADEKSENDFEDYERIQDIKDKANKLITAKYPQWKQLNIYNKLDGYSVEDEQIMRDFINNIRFISDKAETEGTKLEDINWEILNDNTEII